MAESDRRRDYENWHLDKRVNIGHLLTTVMLAGAVFAWAMSIDKRMTRLEVQQEQNHQVNTEIKAELRDINLKMDRLIENIMNNHSNGY